MRLLFCFLFCFISFLPFSSYAKKKEKVEFSVEELERESVLPLFYSREVVKNRIIKKKRRLDFHLGGGWNTSEGLYQPLSVNGNATFNLTESHGLNLFGAFIFEGLSSTGKQIQFGDSGSEPLDFSKVPYPKWIVWLNYQLTTHYGKISLTKNMIMNLSIHVLGGAGGVFLNDEAFKPGFDLGFGQTIYLSRRLSLRFDFLFFFYKGPDLTSEPEGEVNSDLRFIPHTKYKQVSFYNTYLSVGLGFLL